MQFEIFEVTKSNDEVVRIYAHEDLFDHFTTFKKHTKFKNKLKSTKTISAIAYYNKSTQKIECNTLKKKYRDKSVTIEQLASDYKDKIQDTLDYLQLKKSEGTNKALIETRHTYKSEPKVDQNMEGGIVKSVLNYYLNYFNLQPLKHIAEYSNIDVYALSSRGDLELRIQMTDLSTEERQYFQQNSVMLHAMVLLGCREVIGCNPHLIGTLFETIYYIACEQDNTTVRKLLYRTLLNAEVKTLAMIHPK